MKKEPSKATQHKPQIDVECRFVVTIKGEVFDLSRQEAESLLDNLESVVRGVSF